MKSEIHIEIGQDGSFLLNGDLTFESTPVVYERLNDQIRSASSSITIDLEGVQRIDSSGLALLLEWQASNAVQKRTMQIKNAPESLVRLAKLCEADKLLNMSERNP